MPLSNLEEGRKTEWVGSLGAEQKRALRVAKVSVTLGEKHDNTYLLTPSSTPSLVGAVRVGDTTVIVRPKIPVSRVMFLIVYAMAPRHWQDMNVDLQPEHDILEVLAQAFIHHTCKAIRHGLLRGYQQVEDTLNAPGAASDSGSN